MKTRIKIHETKCGPPRVHRMNWKARFEVLTRWRLKKTKNERWMLKNGRESSRNYSRKRYGSASAWIFFTELIFLSYFEREKKCLRGWNLFFFTSPPIYSKIGEKLAAQLAQASKVASSKSNSLLEEGSGRPKWVRLLFVPPFLLNAPPFYFFGNSFSVTLRNFTNFVTILIFLPQGYESLRIMYLLFFSFRRSYGNSRSAQKHLFSTSATLQNFTDRASLLPFDFWDVSGLHLLWNKGRQVSQSG